MEWFENRIELDRDRPVKSIQACVYWRFQSSWDQCLVLFFELSISYLGAKK